MGKFLFRFFLFLLAGTFSVLIFLSYIGLETDKFNNLIKKKANESHEQIKLEFQKTKIYLNPGELNLVVKLKKPKILVKQKEIVLSKLNLYLPLKSFITSDFLLKRSEIAFVENDINDLTKVTALYFPRIINKQFKKIFVKGSLEGEFLIHFESDGSIRKNYEFSGKVVDASINFPKDFLLKNFTAEINFGREEKNRSLKTIIKNGSLFDLQLEGSVINLEFKEDKTKVKSLLYTNGNIKFSQIKKISSLLNLNIDSFKNVNGKANLKTTIDFDLNRKFKVKNLLYSLTGDINYLEVDTEKKAIIKKYLPEYNSKIVLKNTNIQLFNSKSDLTIETNGLIKTKDTFDNFKIKEKYNFSKKSFDIKGLLSLTNSKVEISNLNYKKNTGEKSEINFDVNFILNKAYNVRKLNFLAGKNKIFLSNLKYNKNFEIKDFEKIEVKTFSKEKKNNDFSIEKNKKIIIMGEIFDAEPILKSLHKENKKKTFSKNFKSGIKINFKKVLTGTNDDVLNFAMVASINKGSYNKLSLKGNFSNEEIVEMSIYQTDENKKTIQVISDRARPFIKNFDFIKGFEGGKLFYESVILKENSNSNLTITDFKVSKVPALAKLLTLASLQGIADTLSGEGIRFESFEMKTNSEGNLINIEDALAIGPAISILLDGYIDKGKVVSLRGTLVPATKLNEIIASIPVVGDILVGKKTGEGVVGVSFKMKGPPKDIKTTVNPIKTLTPRFIVRAVEKLKKKKKEEVK
tara:strand:- start:875 stop:3112 length:2238 start_codon:yes stop_codon:yes gene_type:complete